MRRIGWAASIALGALILTIASSWIERFGPDLAVYCALGKSVDGHEIWCPEPVLNGGWPAPYLFDNPGVSVVRQLSFIEDSFRRGPFLANLEFFSLLLIALKVAFSKLFSRVRGSGNAAGGEVGSSRS